MNPRFPRVCVLILLVAVVPALGRQTASPTPPPPPPGTENQDALSDLMGKMTPDEQRYFQHVATLSNPFFEGRAPGLKGNTLAADYCEFYFRQLGLTPLFAGEVAAVDGTKVSTPNSTFRQSFSVGPETQVTKQAATIKVAAGPHGETDNGRSLAAGVDFNTLGMSGSGTIEGPVVFAGYAIESGPDGFASFGEKDDLTGKIALVMRFEPMDERGRSRFNKVEAGAANAWSRAAGLTPKIAAVGKRGAIGVVVVDAPGADDPRAASGRLEDAKTTRGNAAGVPVVMVSAQQGEALAKASGQTLMDLRRRADAGGGVVDLSTSRLALAVETRRADVITDNVGAVLPGVGALKGQYIVIGGHLDHVGYGYGGSRAGAKGAGKLHPGADDNASGTAGVLLAAEQLAAQYRAMPAGASARSVIFLAFSGEELGLLGSRHLMRRSPVPAAEVYAMLNMDMIGRVRRDRIDIYGMGTAENFESVIGPTLTASGMDARTKTDKGEPFGGSGPSDHASFNSAGVPVLHFFSGIHPQYHMPEDWYYTINVTGAVKAVNLVSKLATLLAQRTEPLVHVRSTATGVMFDDPNTRDAAPAKPEPRPPVAVVPPPPLAEKPALPPATVPAVTPAPATPAAPPAATERPAGPRPRFGIAPGDYADDKPGVLVGEVFEGTSAAVAGIKPGDRMTHWNGKAIASVEAWMPLLTTAKVGDKVEVTLLRDAKEMKIMVTLMARQE